MTTSNLLKHPQGDRLEVVKRTLCDLKSGMPWHCHIKEVG
jgi:hypothetical protein